MNKLKEYKEKSGLRYTQIAALVGLPIPTVWRHINGRTKISGESALKYHNALRIPLKMLLEQS